MLNRHNSKVNLTNKVNLDNKKLEKWVHNNKEEILKKCHESLSRNTEDKACDLEHQREAMRQSILMQLVKTKQSTNHLELLLDVFMDMQNLLNSIDTDSVKLLYNPELKQFKSAKDLKLKPLEGFEPLPGKKLYANGDGYLAETAYDFALNKLDAMQSNLKTRMNVYAFVRIMSLLASANASPVSEDEYNYIFTEGLYDKNTVKTLREAAEIEVVASAFVHSHISKKGVNPKSVKIVKRNLQFVRDNIYQEFVHIQATLSAKERLDLANL